MKKSKKILLSLTGLAAFATLPIAAISCQTPTKQDEPKKEDVKTEEPKKDDIKAEESKVDPLVEKANEKAKALAVASHFTFDLGSAYTKSTLLAALEEQGAVLAYSYSTVNIALFKGNPAWKESAAKQIFTVDKSLMTKENKASFQLANPESPTYVSKNDGKTKINSVLKHTLNKDAKTITLEFKGAFFVGGKAPVIGTETVSVTLPIQLEEAPATPEGTTPSTGDSGAQTNPKTENQGSEAQPGGAENQASPTPNGSAGETSTSQSGGSAQAAPSTNDQASGEQAGSAQPSTGTQNSGTGTTENSSGDTSGSGSGAGTSSASSESTGGSSDNQAGAASTSSSETSTTSTPGSQEGASTQTPPASSTSSQPSNTGTEASASQS